MDNTYFKNLGGAGYTKNLNRLFYQDKTGIKDNVIFITENEKNIKEDKKHNE